MLKGYTGDRDENAEWILSSLNIVDQDKFDVLGNRGSRPFELATLRLQNMRQIVTQWNRLSPPDKNLITQQGGTIVFEGRDKIFSYEDKARERKDPLIIRSPRLRCTLPTSHVPLSKG